MRDIFNNHNLNRALSPVSVADNTAQVTQTLDMQGLNAAFLAILTGSLADADATFAVTIFEGNASDMSDETAVAAKDILGTTALASFLFSDDDKCFKIGYAGSKRYIRAKITPANNASAALLAAVWVTEPLNQPAPNPPV